MTLDKVDVDGVKNIMLGESLNPNALAERAGVTGGSVSSPPPSSDARRRMKDMDISGVRDTFTAEWDAHGVLHLTSAARVDAMNRWVRFCAGWFSVHADVAGALGRCATGTDAWTLLCVIRPRLKDGA